MTSGRMFSARNIARFLLNKTNEEELKSAAVTIANYQKYIAECFLISECKPYYVQGKQALNGTKKLYAIDLGLRNSFSNILNTDDSFGLENLIYNELKARGYDVRSGILRNGEIDFVAIKGKKKCFIQVAYYLEKQTTIDREYGAFKNIHDASPKYVFSLDPIDTSRNGITHINIIDFLSGKIDITIS
jgi:predicted AAA+ superfamily ATPase